MPAVKTIIPSFLVRLLNLCCVGFFGPCTKYPECVINIGPRANISIGTSCSRFQNSVMQKLL